MNSPNSMITRFVAILSALLLFPMAGIYAVTAYPDPIRFTQPDGSSLTILLRGDELIHWAETSDGYTILSSRGGAYEYAQVKANGAMGFSGIQAHDPGNRSSQEALFVSKLTKGLFFSKEQVQQMREMVRPGNNKSTLSGIFPTTGTRKLLVILANFSNTTTTYTQTNFSNYMNQANYNGTGSFRDYYLEVSYGQLTVNSTVTVWVNLSNTHDYYGPSSMWGQFALDAVTAANAQASVNFADYDNNGDGVVDGVAIFHQGQGQEESGNTNDIWSHSWDLTSAGFSSSQRTFDGVLVNAYTTMPEKNSTGMGTIGVMCHEFGHNLGAPDFYDTDYSTNGQYNGTGYWDLMASGSWNGTLGNKPAHHNAYTKAYVYGWLTPTVLTTAQGIVLRNSTNYPEVVRYNTTTTNEYFLCENRQQTGFDAGIPGHGMIILHVDGSYINSHSNANNINTGSHQGLYPVCASATSNPPLNYGSINSTSCPYPGTGAKTSFSDATTPNSHSWANANTNYPVATIQENTSTKEISFCFISCTPSLSVTPSNRSVTSASGTTTFTVTSNAAWTVTCNQPWCTATSSGVGNGTVTATFTNNYTFSQRIATLTFTVSGISPVQVTVTQDAAPVPDFNFTIVNDVQTSDRTLEFDLYLINKQPSVPFELSLIQPGILVNSGIINGGTITASLIPGSSELVSLQQPNSISWTSGTPNGCVKIAARSLPGCGNGTIISSSGLGTRVCRVRITNSVPFTAGSKANLDFNYAPQPFLVTKVYHYSGTPCSSNQMTTDPTDCLTLATNPVLNGPPSLSVTPEDQAVTAPAGTASFEVNTNASWNAISDQAWCTITPSGFGSGSLTATYSQNTSLVPRIAHITVTVSTLPPAVVTVTQQGSTNKTLNLSSVFPEGLYNGYSTLFQAMDETGPHWGDGSADHITVELHNAADYTVIEYTVSDIQLSTTGTVSTTVPAEKNASYYITVRHRNSIETTSALPVSFASGTISYAFDATSKAFENNMTVVLEPDGETLSPPLIFGGDVNQDGAVEAEDINNVGNAAAVFSSGYLPEDAYCDGGVESMDINIVGNNAAAFVGVVLPY